MTEHRVITVGGWIAIAAMAALTLATCAQAFVFPLELELREGTAWIHVLAMRAGVSIYDHGQLAFVNMNHGPLDPLLKFGLATVLPFLTPAMVTRFFVVALPLGLWLALKRATPGNRPAALAWAFGLQLFLLGLQPPHFLLGRSDPTTIFFFALMLWQAARPSDAGQPAGRIFLRHFATGALGALTLAANWRNFPAVGAVLAGFAVETVVAAPAGRRAATAGQTLGAMTLGLVAPFALIVLWQFHGDLDLYWRHFFGFFSAASGWGTTRAEAFALVPAALLKSHWFLHAGAAVAVALGLVFPTVRVPRKIQVRVWLPLFALLWSSSSVAYFLNHGGGGLHYYAAFYVLLAFHLARAIDWPRVAWPVARVALWAVLVLGLPWSSVWQQCATLARSSEPAHAFLQVCRETAAGAPIYSEDYQLFKDRYRGEAIDMGDEVFSVRRTGYFGAEFTATANRAFAELEKNPPAFVVTGGCGSPPLQALLARAYTPMLRVPYLPGPFAGPAQTLYRLKPPVTPP